MSGRDEHTDVSAWRPAPAADQGLLVAALLYSGHALNNPIMYVDPSGHVPCIDGNCGSGVYDSFLQDFSYYNSESSPCLDGMCYPESSGQPGGIDEDVGIGDGDGLDVDNIVFAIFEALLGNPDESVDFLNTTSDWIVKFVFPIGFDNFDANGQLINYVVVNQTSFRKAGAWIDGLPKC